MADDFDVSPRASKRRKTYAADRTILTSPKGRGALRNVSNTLSGISSRLFGRNSAHKPNEMHDDSAYGSKEDSLNEDETVVATEEQMGDENDLPLEAMTSNERSMRRSSRKATEVKEVGSSTSSKRAPSGDVPPEMTGKTGTATSARAQQGSTPAIKSRTTTPSSRKIVRGEELNPPQQVAPNVTPQKSSRKKHKSDLRASPVAATILAPNVIQVDLPTQPSQAAQEVEEDAIEVEPRSSGRQRRIPGRFAAERNPADKSRANEQDLQKFQKGTATIPPTSTVASPKPKGILTPSRRRREGPRKSVVFDEEDRTTEEQLGFKDIDTSSKKSNNSTKKQTEIPETPPPDSDDDDHIFIAPNTPRDLLGCLELSAPLPSPSINRQEDEPGITAIKSIILSRLTSSFTPSQPPSHLSNQYSTLHSLLTSTIAQGESNSLLLLGSRGAGKTSLINTALSDLSSKHLSDFHVVRLNGFLQTDDRLALREVWRQLGRERGDLGEVDENETTEDTGSYADTMASLLSLLSHPDDFEDQADANAMDVDEPSTKTSKSVVIILDEFDLFTFHPRQTLLYNLFDIAQSKKAPIAVIGCSTRMDVVDCLEKRVKSRFSHRWLHVPSIRSVEGVKETLASILCVGGSAADSAVLGEEESRWNAYIKSAFIPSPSVQALVQQIYYTTKSLPDLLAALHIPIATLSLSQSAVASSKGAAPSETKSKNLSKAKVGEATNDVVQLHIPAVTPPAVIDLLRTLPTLHLALLTSSARLETIFALTNVNFNAAHQHYMELMARSKTHSGFSTATSMRQWSKEICQGAWEDLMNWELLVAVVGGKDNVDSEGGGKEEISVRMVRVGVTLEEIGWAVKEKFSVGAGNEGIGPGVGEVLGRWCKEE